MKIQTFVLVSALCIAFLNGIGQNSMLKKGTLVPIKINGSISSEDQNNNAEAIVAIAVTDLEGNIVIPTGSKVIYEVERKQRQNFNRPGKVEVSIKSVKGVNGQIIPLAGGINNNGEDKVSETCIITGCTGGTAILVYMFLKGDKGVVLNGTEFNAYLPADIQVSSKSGVAQIPVPPKPVEVPELSENNQSLYRGGGDPLKGLNVAKAGEMTIGNYYALIIGIDNYTGEWAPLKNGVNDAKAVEQTLGSEYKFDQFKTLYNEAATRKNIIREFEWLVNNVSEKDNVLIYYSGHGDYKQNLNKGYWVPIDAKTKSTSEFVSNNDIQTFLTGIKSKHTLLVSDACFSGDLFRGSAISVPFEESDRYYREVHDRLSRQAITSGGVEPVMDGGQDGHSVFNYYFLKSLLSNEKKYYDASQLYNDLKIPVFNNSEQSPQFQPVRNTGDEGGQFIFIRK